MKLVYLFIYLVLSCIIFVSIIKWIPYNEEKKDLIQYRVIDVEKRINKDVFDDLVELEIQITHEVRHLLHFLVRLNLVCWNAFQHFSQIDFDNNISNELLNIKKYFLDENEFITLSSTYIDRLIHIFKQYCRNDNYNEKKLLIQTVLVLADIYPKTMLKDSYWIDIIKNNNKITDSIILFFKELFFNHKQQKIPGNSKSDKYVKLIKWTLNQFDI